MDNKKLSNKKLIAKYEKLLFAAGAMLNAPCFKCGYNGPGYKQPETHPCAKEHHRLYDAFVKSGES